MALQIRHATLDDVDTIVRILIASKEGSFPDTIDEHDRDVEFWTRRWRDYLLRGTVPLRIFGDGWVFIAEDGGDPVAYVAYHHTRRLGTDAELQNIYVLKAWQGKGIGTHLLGVVAHRLYRDGSRSLCVGYDSNSPYKRFYMNEARRDRDSARRALGDLARCRRARVATTASVRLTDERSAQTARPALAGMAGISMIAPETERQP